MMTRSEREILDPARGGCSHSAMFLLYVDESGDVGAKAGSSDFFVLSGFVVHELRWTATLESIVAFRRQLNGTYGLKLREEIHASELINTPGELVRLPKWKRLLILRDCAKFEASLPDVNILSVVVDKRAKSPGYDTFEKAWQALVQRFHNTISRGNFAGPQNTDERGLLITDATDGKKLRNLVRRMRRYNPIPNQQQYGPGYRQILLDTLVEDPVPRDSRQSYFLQLCDVNAYLLMQKLKPNGFFRKKGASNYFDFLDPILCKQAARNDSQGIVRL